MVLFKKDVKTSFEVVLTDVRLVDGNGVAGRDGSDFSGGGDGGNGGDGGDGGNLLASRMRRATAFGVNASAIVKALFALKVRCLI